MRELSFKITKWKIIRRCPLLLNNIKSNIDVQDQNFEILFFDTSFFSLSEAGKSKKFRLVLLESNCI